jgi:integrase/recombinase XerD
MQKPRRPPRRRFFPRSARSRSNYTQLMPVTPVDDDKLIALWLHGRPASTQSTYGADVARFRRFCDRPFPMLRLLDLQEFKDSPAALKPRTQGRILSALKSLLAFGHKTGLSFFNIGAELSLPKFKDDLAERIMEEHARS